ncbi:hypothetical protein [Nitratidesulfovibrio sp.]|uniref:hypothetical protein n=1 Tax=Nitratidesulfovibrio sp. TaxID=2802297 RepID=UPI0033421111
MRYAVITRKNVECRYRAGLRFSPERTVVDADELGPARMSAILADPVLLAVPLGTPVDVGEAEAGAVADAALSAPVAPVGQGEGGTGEVTAAQHAEAPQPATEAAPAPAEPPTGPAKPASKPNSKAGK